MKRLTEELTTALHAELTVDAATDRRHVVATAQRVVAQQLLTREEALAAYQITEAELDGE